MRMFSFRAGVSGRDLARFFDWNEKTGQRMNRAFRSAVIPLAPRSLPGASEWDYFVKQGIYALGWNELGDLREFNDKAELNEELLIAKRNSNSDRKNDALALWNIAKVIKPGDVVFAKRGLHEYVGYGVVKSSYTYNASDEQYPHQIEVDWKKQGSWRVTESQIVKKTLTEITGYKKYVKDLTNLIIHSSTEAETRAELTATGFEVIECPLSTAVAADGPLVREFAGETRFYVARKA